MKTATEASTKAIQRRLSLEFGLKLCKPARKPRLTLAMKKKCLDFAKRHPSWDIDIEIKTFSVYENTPILVFYDVMYRKF